MYGGQIKLTNDFSRNQIFFRFIRASYRTATECRYK